MGLPQARRYVFQFLRVSILISNHSVSPSADCINLQIKIIDRLMYYLISKIFQRNISFVRVGYISQLGANNMHVESKIYLLLG